MRAFKSDRTFSDGSLPVTALLIAFTFSERSRSWEGILTIISQVLGRGRRGCGRGPAMWSKRKPSQGPAAVANECALRGREGGREVGRVGGRKEEEEEEEKEWRWRNFWVDVQLQKYQGFEGRN